MLRINVRVPEARDQAALVEIRSGMSKIADGIAVASASAGLAARQGNQRCDPLRPWGHPPFGSYQFLARGPAPAGRDVEYGAHLLVFQPESGSALEAESFGRLLLPVYAGPAGKGGRLRPTQGGLRMEKRIFDALLGALSSHPEALLEIGVLLPPAWWQFWKRAEPTPPIAPDTATLILPPFDEASLATLIAGGKRLARRTPVQRDDDNWSSSSTDSSSNSSSSGYAGQGGTYAGGGASGGWDGAPAGRGVDAAGRITAAAAGAALVAGAAAEIGASSQAGDDAGTQTSTSY